MQDKSNAELIQLILDATNELEVRRQLNEGANSAANESDEDGDTDEGGDRPPVTHFP